MKKILLLFFASLSIVSTIAQGDSENSNSTSQTSITGKIIDKADGSPLAFAYLTLEKTGLGTVTDGDGAFQISIPYTYNSYTITMSYLGYEDLKVPVKAFISTNGQSYKLQPEAISLNEVVLQAKKMPSAKALLRKVIKQIPLNYVDEPALISGYYRETMKENGVYIKYTDAAVDYSASPYLKRRYKWRDYQNTFDFSSSSGILSFDPTASLHRIHFHHRTVKNERANIINSRSSESLSQRGFNGNIEGGPLSLFARNRVKYQESFLGKKANRDFTYSVSEQQDEAGVWFYVLDFHAKTTKADLDALASSKNRKQWRLANKRKLLKGRIYIDRDDLAVVRYECVVPNELKEYFCGYGLNEIKHFDYKLDIRFKKREDTYYLDKLRHEDEFIFKDSISKATTFYSAISEFTTTKVTTNDVKEIPAADNFANTNFNQLYEFPLEYDSEFWSTYTAEYPLATIDSVIRKDMEFEKPLEKQFKDKHIRNDSMPAPVAKIEPYSFKIHGESYTDNYAWLKDTKAPKQNKPVMDYLRQENDYATNYNIPLRRSQRGIYRDLVQSVEKNNTSLPIKENGYYYYSKYTEDDEYPIYYRKGIQKDTLEKELLNVNVLAEEKLYYNAGVGTASPNNKLIAVYENTTGKDENVLKIKDIENNVFLTDSITGIAGMVWLNNNSFLYVNQEKGTYRSSRVLRHVLGADVKTDTLIFEEKDPAFSVGIQKSKSKDYIFLYTGSSTSSETWYVKMDTPIAEFRCVRPREKNHLYGVGHHQDQFYMLTNKNALNYKIATINVDNVAKGKWEDVTQHQAGVLIQNMELFDNYLVINEKENAQERLKITNLQTGKSHFLKLKEEFYNISIGYNPDFATDSLQFNYSSFETPLTTYKYHMETKEKRLVKQHSKPILHPYLKYIVERKWVTAKDGKQIPLTLIRHKWRTNKGNADKVYLTSYGAYGAGQGIPGGATAHHLVNSGYVYAIAHVRGGDDMGREWYEDGKMFKKMNSFSDFIDCAEYLVAENYAKQGSIVAEGGSAGGLLMGGVVNERPDLFRTVILNVPFVDIINTMLDERLPLTTGEFEEWGNPKNAKEYRYIKSYSPYDNVKAQEYPNLLFLTGLNDTRVGYWEPAKMVAKLRATKTDDNLLLFKTNFSGGHSGGSGRYAGFRDAAYKLALIYDLDKKPKTDY